MGFGMFTICVLGAVSLLFSLLALVVSEPWVEVSAVLGAAGQFPLGAPVVPGVAGRPRALAFPGSLGNK